MSLAGAALPDVVRTRNGLDRVQWKERRILAFFVTQVVGVVFLQKIGLPGPLNVVSVTMLLVFISLPFVAASCEVAPVRLLLFGLTFSAAFVSQLLTFREFSLPSFCLFLIAYLPFILVMKVTPIVYRRAMNVFQLAMMAIAIIVAIQDAWQVLLDGKTFPNMNLLVPEPLRVPGYNYIQTLYYGSTFIKPNAFFFLEVSFVSQFLACALVIELVLFQRLLFVIVFLGALLASFAGTGLLLITIVTPLLLVRLSPRLLFVAVIPGALITATALSYGWYDQIARRLAEFSRVGSSAYWRFIEPGEKLSSFATHSDAFYTGLGAGAAPKYPLDVVWWALTKLVAEYGFLTAVLFYVFLAVVLFRGAPSKIIAFTLFVLFSVMSSNLLSLPVINLCLLLAGLMRVESNPAIVAPGQIVPSGAAPRGG